MTPVGEDCDICGGSEWTPVRGHWKRCDNCGHMDTTIPERMCQVCGRPVGRFAKPSMKLCVDCKPNAGLVTGKHCSTLHCGGKVRAQHGTTICDGCLHELNEWKVKDGPTWKRVAFKILDKPTQLKHIHDKLRSSYKQLSRYKVEEWIKRQVRLGTVVKLNFGIYQAKEPR